MEINNMFGFRKPMDVESQMVVGHGPVAAPEVAAPAPSATPEATAPEVVAPVTEVAHVIPETTAPVAAAPEVSAPIEATITITEAELEARIEAMVQARLAERPSRADILKKQREARAAALKKVKETAAGARDELLLVMDPEGREYVKEDIKAVGDEALRRANEVKDRAAAKAAEAWKWAAGRVEEVAQTAEAGVGDLIEYTAAHIQEPLIKMEVSQDRFFDRLVAAAQLKMDEIRFGVEQKADIGRFALRAAEAVWSGMSGALEREGTMGSMEAAVTKLAREANERATEARRKASEYRGAKSVIVMSEYFRETAAENEKKVAEDRAKRANKFPNFASKLSKLFGKG